MSNHSPSPARTILPRYRLPSSPILGEVAVRPEGYKHCPNRFFFPAIMSQQRRAVQTALNKSVCLKPQRVSARQVEDL